MKFANKKLLLFVWLCCLTWTASAQKFLEKPFQKWSKEEAIKMLTDSPWVQTYQSNEGLAAAERRQAARTQSDQSMSGRQTVGSSANTLGVFPVVIRLHSALPVREALVRLREIEAGYDKMDDAKRTEFDKTTKGLLDCPICKDYYVVTMNKFVNSSTQTGVDEGLFQTMKSEDLKGNVWLVNEKGEKRDLKEFTPPKNARDFAVFFFPRRDEKNNDLLTPQTKELKFVFNNDFLQGGNNPYSSILPRNFEFKVSKLMIGDKIEF